MRERLIETIQNSVGGCARHWAEVIADGLIDSGVILPPCKVGDTLYTISSGLVKEHKIEKIEITRSKICLFFNWHGMGYEFADSDLIGKTVFLSREEAEKALKGGAE